MKRLVAMLVAVTAITSACSGSAGSPGEVIVLAPSSMVDVLSNGKFGLIGLTSTSTLSFSFAGSNSLVAQLREGSNADMVITASRSTMDRAVADGSVAGTPIVIARNRLVLAVARGNPGQITSLNDLGESSKLIGLCAPEVPCGALSVQALEGLGVVASPDTLEPSVRALANKIQLGELDAGLIYLTDALALDIRVIDTPELDQYSTEYLLAPIQADPKPAVALWIDSMADGGSLRQQMLEMGFQAP